MSEDPARDSDTRDGGKISHDLRQPLAAMKTWLELLAVSLRDDATEKQRRYLEKMKSEIGRMTALLNELSSSGD